MHHLIALITQYGLGFVFVNVLAAQAGLPLPAVPTLVLTGALLGVGRYSAGSLLGVAVVAALIADSGWYVAGRAIGRPVLRAMCRISLSPDTCVRQTETIYTRFGPPSLMVAKFIPGFAAIATALSGAVRTRIRRSSSTTRSARRSGPASRSPSARCSTAPSTRCSITLARLGEIGVGLIVLALVVFVALKWWDRRRFFNELRMARITVPELAALLESGDAPMILDVRSLESQLRRRPHPRRDLDRREDDRDPHPRPRHRPRGDPLLRVSERGVGREDREAAEGPRLHARAAAAGGIDAWAKAGHAIERGEALPDDGAASSVVS